MTRTESVTATFLSTAISWLTIEINLEIKIRKNQLK